MLFLAAALRPADSQVMAPASVERIWSNEVGVPIALANPALIDTIEEGDLVDVIVLNSPPQTIARRARVITTSDGGVLLIGVTTFEATTLSGLTVDIPLTVQVHPASLT